jgi:hypothetical protein
MIDQHPGSGSPTDESADMHHTSDAARGMGVRLERHRDPPESGDRVEVARVAEQAIRGIPEEESGGDPHEESLTTSTCPATTSHTRSLTPAMAWLSRPSSSA